MVCIIDTSTYGMYTIYSMCVYIYNKDNTVHVKVTTLTILPNTRPTKTTETPSS